VGLWWCQQCLLWQEQQRQQQQQHSRRCYGSRCCSRHSCRPLQQQLQQQVAGLCQLFQQLQQRQVHLLLTRSCRHCYSSSSFRKQLQLVVLHQLLCLPCLEG
jgi:hypothetical protein